MFPLLSIGSKRDSKADSHRANRAVNSGSPPPEIMLDSDLAGLYGVETRVLIQAIRRNQDRFPEDFMFQLTQKELNALRSQSVISNVGRGGRRYRPYVFTEEGVAMLSTVLRSSQAIHVSIAIMQAFVKLRELL